MRHPPRAPDASLLSLRAAVWPVVQGLAAFAVIALALVAGSWNGVPENTLRATVYCLLVMANIGLILVNRSFSVSISQALLRPNAALWGLVGTVLAVLGCAVFWPPAQKLFHFAQPPLAALLWCALAGAGLVGLLELAKSYFCAARRAG